MASAWGSVETYERTGVHLSPGPLKTGPALPTLRNARYFCREVSLFAMWIELF